MCGFLPTTRLRIDLAEVMVVGIQRARKDKTKMKATIVLHKDLTGRFTGHFTPADGASSKRETSVEFHGGRVLLNPTDSNGNDAVVSMIESGSVIVLDGCADDAWI